MEQYITPDEQHLAEKNGATYDAMLQLTRDFLISSDEQKPDLSARFSRYEQEHNAAYRAATMLFTQSQRAAFALIKSSEAFVSMAPHNIGDKKQLCILVHTIREAATIDPYMSRGYVEQWLRLGATHGLIYEDEEQKHTSIEALEGEIKKCITGARAEKEVVQALKHLGYDAHHSSLEQDLRGIDAILHINGKKIYIDVASTQAGKGHKQNKWRDSNDTQRIIIVSPFGRKDREKHQPFCLQPQKIDKKAGALLDQIPQDLLRPNP